MPDESSLVIVQRQTVNWTELTDEQFYQQSVAFCRLWGKPDDTVWNLFQLWNKTFAVDYREVRQALKQIALDNISEVEAAEFINYQGYNNIPKTQGYYLFIDDDDWIDPKAAKTLAGYSDPLLLWRSANIGSPNQEHVVFVWGMNGRCMTNNYAIHSSWLEPFSKIDQVIQHKDACKIFDAKENIPHLDCALTVSNKSPISSVSLERGLGQKLTEEALCQLVENYLTRIKGVCKDDFAYIPWAMLYVEKMHDLFDEVKKSVRG